MTSRRTGAADIGTIVATGFFALLFLIVVPAIASGIYEAVFNGRIDVNWEVFWGLFYVVAAVLAILAVIRIGEFIASLVEKLSLWQMLFILVSVALIVVALIAAGKY